MENPYQTFKTVWLSKAPKINYYITEVSDNKYSWKFPNLKKESYNNCILILFVVFQEYVNFVGFFLNYKWKIQLLTMCLLVIPNSRIFIIRTALHNSQQYTQSICGFTFVPSSKITKVLNCCELLFWPNRKRVFRKSIAI